MQPKYDVPAPCICYQCGNCCRNYFPQIHRDDLPAIAELLKKTQEAVEAILDVTAGAYHSGAPEDCCFLDPDSRKCLIHEIKPESCLLFPLGTRFGAGKVDCRGYGELKRFTEQFPEEDRKFADVFEPEFGGKGIRYIPEGEWPGLLSKAAKANVSPEFLKELLFLNGLTGA